MGINTYLGFDVGTKRTGVAIANSLTRQASGIEVVTHHNNGSTNWKAFDHIINAHSIDLFIVGLPLDKDETDQEMSFIAKSFGRKLAKKYGIEVVFVNEYLSSSQAKKNLKYSHHHKNANRGEVDKQSAQLILQTWIHEQQY